MAITFDGASIPPVPPKAPGLLLAAARSLAAVMHPEAAGRVTGTVALPRTPCALLLAAVPARAASVSEARE